MHWLRWYIGTCEDGKFRMIARNGGVTVSNAIALWATLLEDASHPGHRGICTRGEDFYGAILDLEPDVIADILSSMERLNMISVGHVGIEITNWNKRQFESDIKDPTNADRQRRFRERNKRNGDVTERNGDVTERNGDVTVEKHQIQNTDTDTDNKKKNIKKKISLEELSVDHIQEWLVEKRSQGKYLTHDEHFVLEQFKQYCQAKGKKYADYVAAYRNAFEWEKCKPIEPVRKRTAFDNLLEGASKASPRFQN